MTLYIDTHYENLAIALIKEGKIKDKRVVLSDKHSSYAIPLIKDILEKENVNIKDLEEIIVINGPGSFTGVRIGIVIAKIMGYTLNIPIKTISYLQALALNYHREVTLGIKDKNGVFVGKFNELHELVGEYQYLKDFDNQEIISDAKEDIEAIYLYLKDKDRVNPHQLVPLYVKRIEALK